jgi:hypothetical protein
LMLWLFLEVNELAKICNIWNIKLSR